ncbi:hypothetical protein N0V88_000743 [Collariella sp. IMI 366227]|nr:hypothetical protein N0V88_000743 [Collariella sp. IMI 366227]
MQFGREWAPDSFPFRELSFALLYIAAGKAKFFAFPLGICHPRSCLDGVLAYCSAIEDDMFLLDHDLGVDLPNLAKNWFDRDAAGYEASLVEFGTHFHRPGEPPGASPLKTMYWFDDVLVSLVLVVDGAALVVMSLFKVTLAEVTTPLGSDSDNSPVVKVSHSLQLSPLQGKQCLSTHPRERPEWKERMPQVPPNHNVVREQSERSNARHYPGLATLINFFDVAAARRSAAKSSGALPQEMYCRILDHCDYDTWTAFSLVSPAVRSHSLINWRIDRHASIVRRLSAPHNDNEPFRLTIIDWWETLSLKERPCAEDCRVLSEWNWMPIFGTNRRALMSDVCLEFVEDAQD